MTGHPDSHAKVLNEEFVLTRKQEGRALQIFKVLRRKLSRCTSKVKFLRLNEKAVVERNLK